MEMGEWLELYPTIDFGGNLRIVKLEEAPNMDGAPGCTHVIPEVHLPEKTNDNQG